MSTPVASVGPKTSLAGRNATTDTHGSAATMHEGTVRLASAPGMWGHVNQARKAFVRTAATLVITLAPAIGLGILVGVLAGGFVGMGLVYAVLILCAVVVALAQQTLP